MALFPMASFARVDYLNAPVRRVAGEGGEGGEAGEASEPGEGGGTRGAGEAVGDVDRFL